MTKLGYVLPVALLFTMGVAVNAQEPQVKVKGGARVEAAYQSYVALAASSALSYGSNDGAVVFGGGNLWVGLDAQFGESIVGDLSVEREGYDGGARASTPDGVVLFTEEGRVGIRTALVEFGNLGIEGLKLRFGADRFHAFSTLMPGWSPGVGTRPLNLEGTTSAGRINDLDPDLNLPVVLAVEYKSPSLQDLTLRVALGTVSEAGPSKSRGAGATLGDNNLLSIEFSYALSALPGASVGLGFLYNDLPSNDDDGLAFVGDSGTTVDLWTLILGFKLTGLVAGLTVEGFAAWQGGHEDADVAGISPSREAYALGARAKWEQDSKLSVDWRGELWSGDDDGDLGTESATKKDSETSFDSYRSATRGSIWNGGIETIEGAYGGFVTANYIVTTAGLNYNVTDTFTARAQIGYARLHRALVLNALRTNQLGASLGLGVLWKPVKSVAVDATADFLGASNVARNTLRGTGTYADPASIAQLLLVGVTFSF